MKLFKISILACSLLFVSATEAAQPSKMQSSDPQTLQEQRVLFAESRLPSLFSTCFDTCTLTPKERISLQTALDVFRLSEGNLDFIRLAPSVQFPNPGSTDRPYTILQTDRTLVLVNRAMLNSSFVPQLLSHPLSNVGFVSMAMLQALTHLGPGDAKHLSVKLQRLADENVKTLAYTEGAKLFLVPGVGSRLTSPATAAAKDLIAEDCEAMHIMSCAQSLESSCLPLMDLNLVSMLLDSSSRRFSIKLSGTAIDFRANKLEAVNGTFYFKRSKSTKTCFKFDRTDSNLNRND